MQTYKNRNLVLLWEIQSTENMRMACLLDRFISKQDMTFSYLLASFLCYTPGAILFIKDILNEN